MLPWLIAWIVAPIAACALLAGVCRAVDAARRRKNGIPSAAELEHWYALHTGERCHDHPDGACAGGGR